MLGYYCFVSSRFLCKDYASALKYLDVIKVLLYTLFAFAAI